MDFDFTEEQEMLRASARRFFETECPLTHTRQIIENELGYDPDLWKKMADLGWLGMAFPLPYGGSDNSFFDLVVLLEEMGRSLMPSAFIPTIVLCSRIILAAGTEDQKISFLPEIAKGNVIMTLALVEPSNRWDPAGIRVSATKSGDNYIIEGTKLFVPYAHTADTLICVARTRHNNDETGITLFLVDTGFEGVDISVQKTITGEKLCEVNFDKVIVPQTRIIGEVDRGWPAVQQALDEGAVAECGAMVGGGRRVLEMAVDYAKQRIQFGVPIGTFQAVQHKCADILTAVDGAAFITYYTAWALTEKASDATVAASKAKAWCSDAYTRITSEGIQILGAMGFTLEHDMQLFFRRARAFASTFGDSQYHRERISQITNS